MKKFLFLSFVFSFLLLAGCGGTEQGGDEALSGSLASGAFSDFSGSFLEERERSYDYSRKMEKPDLAQMDNWDAITNGFHEKWTQNYTVTAEDMGSVSKEYCPDGKVWFHSFSEQIPFDAYVDLSKVSSGKTLTFTGKYDVGFAGNASGMKFSDDQLSFFDEHGWLLFKPTPDQRAFYDPSYSQDTAQFPAYGSEEWVNDVKLIGGSHEAYERFPFNTLLVTNDLLLHVYHKLFSNGLQYYEESQARPLILEIARNQYQHFLDLYKKEQDTKLKDTYAFLTAYWAMPYAMLPSYDEVVTDIQKYNEANQDSYEPISDLSDKMVSQLMVERLETFLAPLPKSYQEASKEALSRILKAGFSDYTQAFELLAANETEFSDPFLASFASKKTNDSNVIIQDYSQFKPRSHYTNSSLLRTYFMAMKWLMREKFYFSDTNLSKAGLVLVRNLLGEDQQNFMTFKKAIQELIGEDDDANIEDIQAFMNEEGLKTDMDILKNLTPQQQGKLSSLRPQKITSTSYVVPEAGTVGEDEMKKALEGFLVFGEKFTLDSYVFDRATAGTAEIEHVKQPNHQLSLLIPSVLEGNALSLSLLKEWMKEQVEADNQFIKENENYRQLSSLDEIISKIRTTLTDLLKDFDPVQNVYHKWLKVIGWLFVPYADNAPYFKLDTDYLLKNMITYLGSYTELKHDTLLYVKQAYAEMGGGGDAEACRIGILPPDLPVPRGYIEADAEIIDQLLNLSASTQGFFENKDAFMEFDGYLKKVKSILLAQMNNDVISDEDFEWLRTSYDLLDRITFPKKLIGDVSTKELRGALIADIFTAEGGDPLYEATGRPYLLMIMVSDTNGKRVVMGPAFMHYEFYQSQNILPGDQRYTDELWQDSYDHLDEATYQETLGIEARTLLNKM